VSAADLDPRLVGKAICEVEVVSREETAELVPASDVAVVTGVSLSNGTIRKDDDD
jgi:hypothetical protein